jgi:hypothetical protein
VDRQVAVDTIRQLPVMRRLLRMGEDIGEDRLEAYAELGKDMEDALTALNGRAATDAS